MIAYLPPTPHIVNQPRRSDPGRDQKPDRAVVCRADRRRRRGVACFEVVASAGEQRFELPIALTAEQRRIVAHIGGPTED